MKNHFVISLFLICWLFPFFSYAKLEVSEIVYQSVLQPENRAPDKRAEGRWAYHIKSFREKRVENDQVIYDMLVTKDRHGFRLTESKENDKGLKHLFLTGCSFTFGTGVNDQETFPSYLSKALPDWYAVNMGLPGAGLSEQLYNWQNYNWPDIYPQQSGVMVFSLVTAHFERWSRKWSYICATHPKIPVYQFSNGEFFQDGILEDSPGYKWCEKLNGLNLTYWWLRGISHFDQTTDSDIISFVHGLQKLKTLYLKQYPNGRFIVAWRHKLDYPKDLFELFERKLKEMKVEYWPEVISEETINHHGGLGPLTITGDGHPNSLGNKLYATGLRERLISK